MYEVRINRYRSYFNSDLEEAQKFANYWGEKVVNPDKEKPEIRDKRVKVPMLFL